MSGQIGESTDGMLAVSIYGPSGVLDLFVPDTASTTDVVREYAVQTRTRVHPVLHDSLGRAFGRDRTLDDIGVQPGDLLVVMEPGQSAADPTHRRVSETGTGAVSAAGAVTLIFWAVGAMAALAGVLAAGAESALAHVIAVDVLVAAALVGVTPAGRLQASRLLVAPAFGAAAAFALAFHSGSVVLPMVVGVSALAAAVTAAVGRLLAGATAAEAADDALRVWMVAGVIVFLLAGVGAVLSWSATIVWGILVLLAMFAARFVPMYAIDVPDQVLIDLERLAVSAWSARDRTSGRRGRMVIRRAAVAKVAARGTRIVTAGAAATMVIAMIAAPLLLRSTAIFPDRLGAQLLCFFAGGALLLAARSYRLTMPRAMLRLAGLGCWVALAADVLTRATGGWLATAVTFSLLLAVVVLIAAVATGRGWRSVWWARRAELGEAVAGAFAIGALVVASGLFRILWEITS